MKLTRMQIYELGHVFGEDVFDGKLKPALKLMGCKHVGHMNPTDFWGPPLGYQNIFLLVGAGMRGAAAGRKLRRALLKGPLQKIYTPTPKAKKDMERLGLIQYDESKNKPKDMEKYWTKPWEEIIEDDGDEKTS